MAQTFETAIIGAGASGLMCASQLNDPKTLLLESNANAGKKIAVSGGGRCNVTNEYMDAGHFLGDPDFIAKTLEAFDQKGVLSLLKAQKVPYSLDPKIVKGTYFCKSSKDLLRAFAAMTDRCTKVFGQRVTGVKYEKGVFVILTESSVFYAKRLVVASGGPSYPQLGAGDIGYRIAEHFGHRVAAPVPALVGFTVQKPQFWFKTLSGLSLDVTVSVGKKHLQGALLCTHKGISGPAILSASLYWQKGLLAVDFMPQKKIRSFFKRGQNLSNALPLPKRFIQAFLDAIGLRDKPCNGYDSDEKKLLESIHRYEFAPAGNFGYAKAEVTKGGIDTAQIDASMQSKLQKDLYFTGEVLDVTGELGGYNIQWALSSGYVCARAVVL